MKNILFVFLLFNSLFAQSFIGYINKNPIWFEIKTDTTTDTVTGNYFYKNVENEINFSGTKNGQQIELTEKDEQQTVTGLFTLTDFGDSINGTWQKPDSKTEYNVRLYKTDPSNKEKMINKGIRMFIPGIINNL